MNTRDEILIAIGRIEGKLEAFASLSQRVSTLERWQAWLKGGWGRNGRNVCVAVSRIPVEVVDDYGRGRQLDLSAAVSSLPDATPWRAEPAARNGGAQPQEAAENRGKSDGQKAKPSIAA